MAPAPCGLDAASVALASLLVLTLLWSPVALAQAGGPVTAAENSGTEGGVTAPGGSGAAAGKEPGATARIAPDGDDSTDEDSAAPLPDADAPPRRGSAGPAPAPRGPSAYAGLATALPSPSEAGHIDNVDLPAREVAVISGRSTWDDGFKSLFDSFDVLAAELAKVGVKPVGRPLAVFVSTDEAGFSYEAMAPVAAAPADPGAVGGGVRFERTPGGKAIRFTHKAPYEEIDATYEAITAYLDSRGIEAEDAFTEEYVTDPKDPSDPTLQINIYVEPKRRGAPAGKQPGAEEGAGEAPGAGQTPEAGKAPAAHGAPHAPHEGK